MSYTEIYKFKKDGSAECIAQIKNAWRGAMAIWNIMDEKYLPPYKPAWAIGALDQHETYYRAADPLGKGIKEVWALMDDSKTSDVDRIVLGSTFDNVIVKREHMEELITAFEAFEGETSLKEQAQVLTEALKDDDLVAIAWNQTSVNESWAEQYDFLTGDKHWSLFDEIEKIKKGDI